MTFGTSGAERMRIASDGNIQLGSANANTNAGRFFDIYNTGADAGTFAVMRFITQQVASASTVSADFVKYKSGGLIINNNDTHANAHTSFGVGSSERMRIDSAGNLLVGGTSQLNGTGTSNYRGFACVRSPGATAGKFWNAPYVASNNTLYIINNSNAGVYMADGETGFSANSDERLKDIIEPIVNATEKVSSLRAVIGKYKTDEEGKRRSFLIAQDVQAVLPEAVTASKLPNSEDDTEYLGIAYTEVIPLLVAAIKEQQATIEALEARITALEAS
jgi:hypothetical protein